MDVVSSCDFQTQKDINIYFSPVNNEIKKKNNYNLTFN